MEFEADGSHNTWNGIYQIDVEAAHPPLGKRAAEIYHNTIKEAHEWAAKQHRQVG